MPNLYMGMGETAENVADLCGISREDQDLFAMRSQHRVEAARDQGFWAKDITPVRLPDGTVVDADDSPRSGVTLEALSTLTPAFREGGSVTAGNACPLSDGAVALVLMSDRRAREL